MMTQKQIMKMAKVTPADLKKTANHMRNYYAFNPYIGWQMVHVGFESKNHYKTILDCLKMDKTDITEIRLDNRKMS